MNNAIKELFPIISEQKAQEALRIKRRNKKGWQHYGVGRAVGAYIEALASEELTKASDRPISYAHMLMYNLTKTNARKLFRMKNKSNYTWTFLKVTPNMQRKINHLLND